MNPFGILDFGFSLNEAANKKVLFIMLSAMLFALCSVAQAQQEKKVARIGLLASGEEEGSRTIGAFREELPKFGWVEGTNILIDYRRAEGNRDGLRELADGFVRRKVDLIVVPGNQALAAAKAATSSIPIIVLRAGDLLGSGIVTSLARPGGNITGSTRMSTELAGKRMELLKESLSQLSRVGIILATRQDEEELKAMQGAARQLSVKIQPANVRGLSEFQGVFASMMKEHADAVIIVQSGVTFANRGKLLGLASKHLLPSMCEESAWSDAGCLMSYGPDVAHLGRRGAYFVDKVLKGAKPGDLPVERPTKFELVINLKTAKQIGLTIPPNVLARADRVIR